MSSDVDPSKPFYVRFEVPKEVVEAAYETLNIATNTGKIKKGTNETTKTIERGRAALVLIAENVEPPEIVAHLPLLCDERNTPYIYVPEKQRIGSSAEMAVPSAAAAIVDPGDAEQLLEEIINKLKELI
ncbi:MAG: 50S ribosomal protein L7Ae [Candidatus Bathyarchaeia archaeon]